VIKRVQKIKPEIEFFESQGSQSKFTELITHIEKVFELGTQFPHDILTGDFTSRASSETTETVVTKKVRGFQRYLSNKLKTDLFNIILEQNGFNPEEVKLEVSFTAQNIVELEPDQVSKQFTDGIISLKEARAWYASNAGQELDDKEMDDLLAKADFQQTAKDLMSQRDMDKDIDQAKQDFGEKLEERDTRIDDLQNKLLLRESSTKYDRMKLTKEILEEIKKL